MARSFNIPDFYRSGIISSIKRERKQRDPRRKDFSPTEIAFGPLTVKIARHFGFCFGVENAIEIAYRAVEENPDKRIFLLSEMIHNPQVNADLEARGVRFLMSTGGTPLIDFSELTAEDIVIVPAFGTTVQLQKTLQNIGIDPYYYDTTCPFVEKVWKRAANLGKQGFTVVIHGKKTHEETRATFSHSEVEANTVVILDMQDAEFLIDCIKGIRTHNEFMDRFGDCISDGFDPNIHLARIGVVNQTTMLASETHAISQRIREAMLDLYGEEKLKDHFADTRDTLCYATNENQTATKHLIESSADVAIVVGGYNSSNTSHLVELCQEQMPTFYIKDCSEILSSKSIRHFDLETKSVIETQDWLPPYEGKSIHIALTSGASCPDKTVDQVLERLISFFPEHKPIEDALAAWMSPDSSNAHSRASA